MTTVKDLTIRIEKLKTENIDLLDDIKHLTKILQKIKTAKGKKGLDEAENLLK